MEWMEGEGEGERLMVDDGWWKEEVKVGEGERGWNWKEVGRGGRGVRPKGRDMEGGLVV